MTNIARFPVLRLTDVEREIIEDRLELDDCLQDVLGEEFGEDNIYDASRHLLAEGKRGYYVLMSPLRKAIIEDCVAGSTWAYRTDSAVSTGHLPKSEAAKCTRAQRSIERKLAALGIDVYFPHEPTRAAA